VRPLQGSLDAQRALNQVKARRAVLQVKGPPDIAQGAGERKGKLVGLCLNPLLSWTFRHEDVKCGAPLAKARANRCPQPWSSHPRRRVLLLSHELHLPKSNCSGDRGPT